MKNKYFLSILFALAFPFLHAQQVTLTLVTSAINAPVDIKNAGDGRLFIVDRSGTIRIIDSTGALLIQPFLDISTKVVSGGEQGLLGLAFDPNYKSNGFFYVNYTRHVDGATTISRFHSTSDANQGDGASEQILLTIYQPFNNHNGGDINFGPDNYLYIGMGDGGSEGDPGNRSQNLDTLLGKILRIDVSDTTVPYKIPADNPFVGKAGRDEIWDYGVHNPWRFSFDRQTGEIWIGDVGQDNYEEIDREAVHSGRGINYGWHCYEGDSAYNLAGCGSKSNDSFLIYTYNHNDGSCAITGGYLYRGTQFPSFSGKYFFADYCIGQILTSLK